MILYPDGRVEGTPEEIAQWHEMQGKKQIEGWFKLKGASSTQDKDQVAITSKCPTDGKPCYCTGACMGSKYTVWHGIYPPPCDCANSKNTTTATFVTNIENADKNFDVEKFEKQLYENLEKQGLS